MIFIIICALILFVTIAVATEDGPLAVVAFILSSLAGGLVFIMAWSIGAPTDNSKIEVKSTTQHELVAMGSSQGVSGRTYLGTSSFEGKPTITYIERVEGQGVQLKKADADEATIYEISDKEPVLTVTEYSEGKWWLAPFDTYNATHYSFEVPEGTVANNYELSAK